MIINVIAELIKYKDEIEILSGIGTFLSAVVSIYMIKEIRKQRKSTYQPDLFLDSFCFKALTNPIFRGDELIYFMNLKYNESIKENKPEDPYLFVRYSLENIGFGVAKKVTCKWEFDFVSALSKIEEVLPRCKRPSKSDSLKVG